MGYVTHEGSTKDGYYANFSNGKIVTKKNGQRVEYDGVRGHVLGIDIEQASYEGREYEKVVVYLRDSENTDIVLGFPLANGYGSSFCKMAKNVDWKLPVEFSGGVDAIPGTTKKYVKMFLKQPDMNDKLGEKWINIKWAYTEKQPGKMPPAEEGKDRNGIFKDYSKRNDFFRKLLIDFVYKAIKKIHPDFDPKAHKKSATTASGGTDVASDDMPF